MEKVYFFQQHSFLSISSSLFNVRLKPKIGRLSSITIRWTHLNPFDFPNYDIHPIMHAKMFFLSWSLCLVYLYLSIPTTHSFPKINFCRNKVSILFTENDPIIEKGSLNALTLPKSHHLVVLMFRRRYWR